jgi:hypothetical protein
VLTRSQPQQLAPWDPSTNHNVSRRAQPKGTAYGSSKAVPKSTGSPLWTHGKCYSTFRLRGSLLLRVSNSRSQHIIRSVVPSRLLPRQSKHCGSKRGYVDDHDLLLIGANQQSSLDVLVSNVPGFLFSLVLLRSAHAECGPVRTEVQK